MKMKYQLKIIKKMKQKMKINMYYNTIKNY